MKVLGLVSGTSLDGIDAAAVEIERTGGKLAVDTLRFEMTAYPPQLRDRLEQEAPLPGAGCFARVSSLNVAIGEAFAAAGARMCEQVGGIALVGSHGQTVFHQPRPRDGVWEPSTLQLGEPAVIAQRTGLTTVADFRVADVAAGGHGAPLVSFVDHLLLCSETEYHAALNIGGIANLTLLPPRCAPHEVRAFDCGPGNLLIDRAVRALYPGREGFDRNGAIAAAGVVNQELLEWLLREPYFSAPPPKTAGREEFGPAFFATALQRGRDVGCDDADIVATLTELTACTIAAAVPDACRLLVVSGGGAHNAALTAGLARRLASRGPTLRITRSDEFGLGVDAKEAIAFAVLAYEALHGCVNTLPAATGAHTAVVAGKIVPGKNYSKLMRAVWK